TPGAEIPAPPPPPPAAADSPPAQPTPPPPPPPPRHDAEKPPPGPRAKRISFAAAYAKSARMSGPARPIFGRLALESSAVPTRAVMIPVLYRAGSVRIPPRAKRPVGLCSGEPDLRRTRRVFSAAVERDLCVRLERFGRGGGCRAAGRGRGGVRRVLPAERAWAVSPLPVVGAESGSAPEAARGEDDGAEIGAEVVVGAEIPVPQEEKEEASSADAVARPELSAGERVMEPPAGVAAPAITEARDEASSTVRVAQPGLGAGESGAEPVGVEPIPVKRTAEGGQGWGDGEPRTEDGDEEMESEVDLTAADREMLLAGEEEDEDEDEDDGMGGESEDGAAEDPDDGMAMTEAAPVLGTIGHDWTGGQFADLEVNMDGSVRDVLAGIDAAAAGPAEDDNDEEIVDWQDVDLSDAPAGASSSGADDVASRATGGQSSLLMPSHPHPARDAALSPPQSGPAAPARTLGVQASMTAATASDFDAWLASQGYSLGAAKQGTKRGRAREDAVEDALDAEAVGLGSGLQAIDRAVVPAQGPTAASPAPAAHEGDSARQQGKRRANAATGAPQGEVLNAMEPTAAYKVLAGLDRAAVELRIVAWTSQSCMDLLQLADSAERGDVATAKEIYELDIINTRLAQMAEYVQEAAGDWRGWLATFRHGAQMQYSRQHLVDIEKDAQWLSQCYANAAATRLEQILQLCGHLMRGEA
ncbi:hypothetical protein LTR53_017674, partial [Teratosphaeriaceae sp. CCFEE 6253]